MPEQKTKMPENSSPKAKPHTSPMKRLEQFIREGGSIGFMQFHEGDMYAGGEWSGPRSFGVSLQPKYPDTSKYGHASTLSKAIAAALDAA